MSVHFYKYTSLIEDPKHRVTSFVQIGREYVVKKKPVKKKPRDPECRAVTQV